MGLECCRIVPPAVVPLDQPAQPALLRWRQAVELVCRTQQEPNLNLRRCWQLCQPSQGMQAVKARAPYHGQPFGMGLVEPLA